MDYSIRHTHDPKGQLTITFAGRSYTIAMRTYYQKGGLSHSSNLYLRHSIKGKQSWINLGTDDPELAKVNAAEKLLEIEATGGVGLLDGKVTIGHYLKAYKTLGVVSKETCRDYRNKVLKTVGWIIGMPAPNVTRGPRRKAWEAEVSKVKISQLSDADLELWREEQVGLCRRDNAERKSPRTPNGQIAAWRAVFKKSSLWQQFGLTGIPGLKLKKLRAKKVVFKVLVPLQNLIDLANAELKDQDPDCYDLFLLAAALGLRLKEADRLMWSAFRFDTKTLNLTASVLYGYKSYSSEGEVAIYSPVVLEHFRKRFDKRTSDFVIESDRPAGEEKDYNYYRCEPVANRLKAWLKSKGVVCGKPIHYLRGAGGNQVRIDNDIFAAKCFLRHADIQTTIEYYSEVDLTYRTSLKF